MRSLLPDPSSFSRTGGGSEVMCAWWYQRILLHFVLACLLWGCSEGMKR